MYQNDISFRFSLKVYIFFFNKIELNFYCIEK